MRQAFTKDERLTSKKIIDHLFENGTSFVEHPLRFIWMESQLNSAYPVQMVVAVPKKNISKANKRNLMKRRIKEAYRKNKQSLYDYLEKQQKQWAMAIVFTSGELVDYQEIEDKIILSLHRLIKEK